MNIKKDDGNLLDLPEDLIASVDYEIFSTEAANAVSVIKGVDLPATPHNISVLNIGTDGLRQNIEMTSYIGRSFLGTLDIKNQGFNGVDDTINCNITERIKKIFDDIDINISDLVSETDTFHWDFKEFGGDIPSYSETGWFLTTGDFCGYGKRNNSEQPYDYDISNVPVYATKFNTNITQMLWTISIYNFLKKVFDYYLVDFSFTESTELANGITAGELYLFIPAQFAVDASTLSGRDVETTYNPTLFEELYNSNGYIDIAYAYPDGLEQGSMMALDPTGAGKKKIVCAADTEFSHRLYGYFGVTTVHQTLTLGTLHDATLVNPSTAKCNVIAQIKKEEIIIAEYDLGSVMNANGINGTISPQAIDFVSTENMMAYGAESITLDYVLKFENYEFYKYASYGETVMLNGIYDQERIREACGGLGSGSPRIESTDGVQRLTLTAVKALKPVKRNWTTGGVDHEHIDVISVKDSMLMSRQLVLPLIEDIVKRFNLGFWMDGDGKINISYFNARYNAGEPVNLSLASGERYKIEYNENLIDAFTYTNRVGSVKSFELNTESNNVFNYGDVVYEKWQTPNKKIDVSLNSCIATPALYGDGEEEDILGNLRIIDDIRFWGYGNKQQIETDDLPIMIGFVEQYGGGWSLDIRLPRVTYIYIPNREATDDVNDPFITYTQNGGSSEQENTIRMGSPIIYDNVAHKNINMGDINGNVDETSNIYNNFDFIINNEYNNDLIIDAVVSKSQLDNLLDSGVVYIKNLHGVQSTFRTLKIEGFLFDREQSVVTLTLRHFDNDEPT